MAALLYCWDLARVGMGNTFYAAAVKSGTESWKAFFFGSLDPGSFITVDKPPAALWVMELSGRIFGFSSWSMLLPEAIAGLATVMVLYHLVRNGSVNPRRCSHHSHSRSRRWPSSSSATTTPTRS